MKRKIIYTQDGSTTLEIEAWGEHYHSMRGAIGEAYHVFIRQGLELFVGKEISLLEIGLGTGLNAFITFLEHERQQQTIHYEGVEAYPLTAEEVACLNYPELLHAGDKKAVFELLHSAPWDETVSLSPTFTLKSGYNPLSKSATKSVLTLSTLMLFRPVYNQIYGQRPFLNVCTKHSKQAASWLPTPPKGVLAEPCKPLVSR